MPDLTDAQLEQLDDRNADAEHLPTDHENPWDRLCVICGDVWPCDPILIHHLIAEVRRQRAAIAEAEALHRELVTVDDYGHDYSICDTCFDVWPCGTHAALHPEEASDA